MFLRSDDESHAALTAAVAAVTAEVNRWAREGAWSGIDGDELAAAVEALDPLPASGVAFADVVDEVGRVVLANGVRPSDPRRSRTCTAPRSSCRGHRGRHRDDQPVDGLLRPGASGHLVEDRLVRRLAEVCGLPTTASGVMTAGGTASNVLGLVLAAKRLPDGGTSTWPPTGSRARLGAGGSWRRARRTSASPGPPCSWGSGGRS